MCLHVLTLTNQPVRAIKLLQQILHRISFIDIFFSSFFEIISLVCYSKILDLSEHKNYTK